MLRRSPQVPPDPCKHENQGAHEHTQSDGTVVWVAYCKSCGMEWRIER